MVMVVLLVHTNFRNSRSSLLVPLVHMVKMSFLMVVEVEVDTILVVEVVVAVDVMVSDIR